MHYNQSNSQIPSDHVTAILADGENHWIGTDAGLAFFDGSNWTVYESESSELPDDFIRDIHQDYIGNIWVATDGGLLKITTNGMETFTTSNSSIPSDYIRSVTTDSEGNVWIGTWGEGIARKNGSNWNVFNTNNSNLPSDGIFTIEIDELGVTWVGSYNGGVSKFNGFSWETFNTSNSDLPHNHVRTISFDENHDAWFGTENGIAKKSANGLWDVYQAENIGYSFHTVYTGIVAAPGVTFFATDGGMLKFVNSTFSMVTAQNSNLPSNNLRSMELDDNGNLWLGSGTEGVSIYSVEGSLGIKDQQKGGGELTIYPNPTVDEISIRLPMEKTGKADVQVISTTGQVILQKQIALNLSNPWLNVKHLPKGTYFVTVNTDDHFISGTFLKL
ncbi:MAG: two-component regulator propeller domain-containing protein [Flavobacteriales bacterium]